MVPVSGKRAPLVSCVMPTHARPDLALKSISYFQRQDYAACELIVVDDGPQDLEPHIPVDARIRYVRVTPPQSLGAMRNLGCELALGSIIAQWDDDDWYASSRLRMQVQPLLNDEADICGLRVGTFFDLENWKFWRCTETLNQRLFLRGVHDGTLVYFRWCWSDIANYRDARFCDSVFLEEILQSGARLCMLPDHDLFLYLRHGHNQIPISCGDYFSTADWRQVATPRMIAEDWAFYADLRLPCLEEILVWSGNMTWWAALTPGTPCRVVFFQVDLARHSSWVANATKNEAALGVAKTRAEFCDMLSAKLRYLGFDRVFWAGDGGLFARQYVIQSDANLVGEAARIAFEWFNEWTQLRKLRLSLQLRATGTYIDDVIIDRETGNWFSQDLNAFLKYEREFSYRNAFVITNELHAEMDPS
jgi:glycosyltransferase involved in cell wall biosynthesis